MCVIIIYFKLMALSRPPPFEGMSDLYQKMRRKQKVLPKMSGAFVTLNYLWGVQLGAYWVPTKATHVHRECVTPPPKAQIFAEVKRLLDARGLTIGDTEKGLPDVPWLLDCLATLDEDHRFFDQNYVAPPRQRRNAREPQKLDGFDDLDGVVNRRRAVGK